MGGGPVWDSVVFLKSVTYRPTLSKFRVGPVKKNTLYVYIPIPIYLPGESFSISSFVPPISSSFSHSFSIFLHPGCKDAASFATLLHTALMQIFQFLGWKQI